MRKLLLLLIPLILLSCINYEYKFSKDVEAKVIGRTHRGIGLTYDLFGVEVRHDIYNMSDANVEHFKHMDVIPLTVKVIGKESQELSPSITIVLYYKDEEFANKTYTPSYLKPTDFYELDHKIPGFKWHAYNEIEYTNPISPEELREKLKEKDEKESTEDEKVESKQPEKELDL